jgi:hypothetical protein
MEGKASLNLPPVPRPNIWQQMIRLLQYSIVSKSRIRHCFFEVNESEKIERELQNVQFDNLELINNKNYNFIVKRIISEEDKEFLRTFNPHYLTPEEQLRFGRLLGYPCVYIEATNPKAKAVRVTMEVDGRSVHLFSFVCTLTPEEIAKCKELYQDLRSFIKVIMIADGKNIETLGGRKKTKRTKRKY